MSFDIEKSVFQSKYDRNVHVQQLLRLISMRYNTKPDIQELYNIENEIIKEIEDDIRLLHELSNKEESNQRERIAITTDMEELRDVKNFYRLARYKAMKIFGFTPKGFKKHY